ncbi:phosphatidylinositol transfer protein csr1 [Coemansia sp. RSA 989]|nr:phosphatidylinositol transfer protein csr1 [Coemansia sp. RSA 989]KAJ1873779.1 phosphatidylinositol transfer protein csr1 [Coemansia sp. RSA 990]KAJ2627944.1 phosphatidylinositol transfer protein csr1 [Coemansia sp. RSA 1290]KAJ2649280.1 phosphatidylinositol transfer protein csr1 [Coemansia sp. RSA 1250]KAJ2671987.1 phosphatidylinositol transfer protein csr1 [Coemansia sp. RSA 1085]
MESTPSLLEHYRNRTPLTDGRVGFLTDTEKDKLRQLWQLIMDEIDSDNQPFPVLYSLTQADSSDDITSLSFEPLVSLSSKDREIPSRTPSQSDIESTSSQAPKKKPTGWLGWISSGQSTPQEEPTEDARLRQHETVQCFVSRNKLDRTLVPAAFQPLFNQSTHERTFRSAFWQAASQMSNPDSWVLRFLRARKWDVDAAMQMLHKTLQWRVGQAIDEIVFYGESLLHYHTMQTGLAFACAKDKLENPVYVVRVRVNLARNRNIQAIKRFLCWQIETSQLLASGQADGRVTIVFDMTDFTRENIDLKLVRTLITLLTSYYPETLGMLLLYVNSFLFSSLWSLISPFIDPVVKSKIFMAKSPSDLALFIDSSQLIKELGGCKPFEYRYQLPTRAENIRMRNAAGREAAESRFAQAIGQYEERTREWLGGSSRDPGACSRDAACEALHAATVELDPFVRARTLYHRLGLLGL